MSFESFFSILYPGLLVTPVKNPHVGVVLFAKQSKLEQYFPLSQMEQLEAWILQKVEAKQDVYFTVTLQDSELNSVEKKKRSIKGACASPGVWVDVDFTDGTEAHKRTDLPTEAEARAFFKTLPIPPSLLVRTGHGLHVYWLLPEPWLFNNDQDREKAAALVKGFQATLRKQMVAKGWSLDSTADLARLLRIPGTLNYKCSQPLEVTLEETEDIPRYSLEVLSNFIEPEPEPAKAKAKAPGKKNQKPKNDSAAPPSFCAGILKRCGFIQHCQSAAATLPEPEWYAMVSILAPAADGPKVIHAMSASYPGYQFAETEAKISHALEASGPMTCMKIAEMTGGTFCSTCACNRKVKSPIQLGAPPWNGDKEPLFMTCELDEELKTVEASLGQCEDLYSRGGRLVRVVTNALAAPAGAKHTPLEIQEVHTSTLREMLCSVHLFFKPTQNGARAQYPPDQLVTALMERGHYPHLHHLRGITEVPVLRPDGTVAQDPGYDDTMELYYEPCAVFPRIPDFPTSAEVRTALDKLLEVVADFPFVEGHGKAVFLAAVLTVIGRFAFRGPSPMILIDANVPGIGKTKLADIVGIIVTGMPLPRVAQTKNEEEERKRITSILLKGRRILLLDNINSRLGSGVLDALLTSDTWQDRVLGHSREVSLPNHLLVLATGNNLELQADTVRRCLRVQLLSHEEHPETRAQFLHPDLEAWVIQNQPTLLAAALTLLRAYVAAGRPKTEMKTLGSYSGWSQLIQATVKWATGMDPGDARIPFNESIDLDSECLQLLMDGWREIAHDGEVLTCRQAIERLDRSTSAGKTLHEAMDLIIPGSKRSAVDLGRLLKKFRKRVRDEAYFDHAGTSRSSAGHRWHLVSVTKPSAPSQGDEGAGGDGIPGPSEELQW